MAKAKFICQGIYKKNPDEENIPSPCKDLPYYGKHEGKSYCILHIPIEDKLDDFSNAIMKKFQSDDYNYRGIWVPNNFYFNRQRFKTKADFTYAFFKGDANFGLCVFEQEVSFDEVVFDSDTNFSCVIFGNQTSFINSVFNKLVDFSSSQFGKSDMVSNVDFYKSVFAGNTDFTGASFDCEVTFLSSKFYEIANFERSTFRSNVEFQDALFKDSVRFSGGYLEELCYNGANEINKVFGSESSLDLQFSVFEKPERVSFHTSILKPHWFVNVDPRKFEFTDIEWKNVNKSYKSVNAEIEDLTSKRFQSLISPYKLLSIACKRLASNSEDNNNYEDGSNFRQLAFETERLERIESRKTWRKSLIEVIFNEFASSNVFLAIWRSIPHLAKSLKTVPFDFIHFSYRWLSGYGENWFRAFCWLIFIWLFFAIFYTTFGTFGTEGKDTISCWKSFGYSLQVMALQKPEPRPFDALTYFFYGIETIFAPVQAALLALAIRRKFMR